MYLIIYREKKQKQAEGKEEREQGRRMPPTSSPVPSLSSVLSAVITVHTIASGSPLRHHRTINQQPATTGKRLGLSVILPASSYSPSSSILQVVRYGKAKEQTEQEEREPGRRMPPPSSPVPRLSFCSVCCLYRPHHRQPLTTSPACVSEQGEGRADTSFTSGRCHRHHLATTSPPIDQQPATTGQRLDVLPSCPPRPRPLPLLQVLMVGHRASQGGRFPPAHPVEPLHTAGVHRHICGHPRR